jgi:hypothetical protein
MSDIRYRIESYSDIRYNIRLRSLQSDIGSSDIKLSPISLITDNTMLTKLYYFCRNIFMFILLSKKYFIQHPILDNLHHYGTNCQLK